MNLRDYQQEAVTTLWNGLFKDDPQLCVISTGGGKTRIATALLERVVNNTDVRIMFLVQRINLVEQTEKAFAEFLPKEKIGAYCASLNRREFAQITISTIQSISKADVDRVGLLVIDEVHNFGQENEDGRYYKFLGELRKSNPKLKIIGLTATPYNKEGFIYGNDKLFSSVSYKKGLSELIRYGYLVKPVLKHGLESFDTNSLHVRGGEYSLKELEEMTADARKVHAQVKDALPRLLGRKKVAWACTFIKHAELVARELQQHGETVSVVHSNLEDFEREIQLAGFTVGENRHMVFVTALSEGWDYPPIDAICLMRPTRSATLYVQICGRGLRTSPGKENCLILDYGRVVQELGPLDNPKVIDAKTSKKVLDEKPMKFCVGCLSYIPKSAKTCPDCGMDFAKDEFTKNLTKFPAEDIELINEQYGYIRTYEVSEVSLSIHNSKNGNQCLKVSYWPSSILRGGFPMAEFFVWNQLFSRSRAKTRLKQFGCNISDDLIEVCSQIPSRQPYEVKYVQENKFPRIVELCFREGDREGDSSSAQSTT